MPTMICLFALGFQPSLPKNEAWLLWSLFVRAYTEKLLSIIIIYSREKELLQQHGRRVLEVALECLEPFRTHGTVDDPVVAA